MKTNIATTAEQSARLLKCGVPAYAADMTMISVYKPISRFKRLMLRWCFGLKFEKI